MKKIGITAGILLLAILMGIFLIQVKDVNTDVTRERTKVGVVMNGKRTDNSWSQSHYEAMEKTAESLNLELLIHDDVGTEECEALLGQLAGAGCQIIICNSFGFGEAAQKVAAEYPKIHFFHATGVQEADNLATYFGRIYQMRYLCGIVAGLQTETNEIGYVAAFPISEVNRGINAFTLGVRSVNPGATVHVAWSNSWEDDDLTEGAARRLLERYDIDIFAMHTDSLKVLEVAEEQGIWSIGYNMDNEDLFRDSFLTAAVWDWEKFYTPRILEALQGKFQGKHYWEGIQSGVVGLAPFTSNVKPGIAEVVRRETERLESGSFDVFYGPIRDQDGRVRVPEGESMTDDAMLNVFDWYVEGVSLDE